MQDGKFGRRCVGSHINCCNPYDIVSDSIWGSSWDVISSYHHDLDLALKSPSFTKSDNFSCLAWLRAF